MKTLYSRILALCLCFCLLPVFAFADTNDGTPVTHSELELSLRLYADGFPEDGRMHYRAWESYLNRLSLRGSMDTQSFPSPLDRVYFNGGLYLDDRLSLPFEYDGYYNFRYVRSPALGGASVHFQMYNFFQFMLKPYYYMNIPTQYLALLLYPEATVEMWRQYAGPIAAATAGTGSRTIAYEPLQALAQQLNAIVLEDDYSKAYYYITCLLTDLGMDWTASDKLAAWDLWLEGMDPEKQGLSIAVSAQGESWTLGQTTLYRRTVLEDETLHTLYLPDQEGYELWVELKKTASEATVQLTILQEGETLLGLSAGVDGLPAENALSAQGSAWAALEGSLLPAEAAPLNLRYRYSRTAAQKPYDLSLAVDALNSETGKPCLGFEYRAAVQELPHTALVERAYDDQEDFFHLNESFLEEYRERFMLTLVLAAAPFVLELPAGVISDAIAYMEQTGILAFLGIE